MKENRFFDIIILFFGSFLSLFCWLWVMVSMLFSFELVTDSVKQYGPLIISMLLSMGIVFLYIFSPKGKMTKLKNWFLLYYPKVILGYILSIIAFGAIKKDVIFDYDMCKSIITIDWSIFTISIAIFLVWGVIIKDYIKDERPTLSNDDDIIKKIEYYDKRRSYYANVSNSYNSLILLTINLYAVVIATAFTFFAYSEIPVLTQDIAIISFLLCTNTIFSLFSEIAKPIRENKKIFQEKIKTTLDDVNAENQLSEKVNNTIAAINEILDLDSIDTQQKIEIAEKLLISIGVNRPHSEKERIISSEKNGKEVNHDQL